EPGCTFVLEPQLLSASPGVDISRYLGAAINRIRANWFAVMPEAARTGGKGRVDIIFSIARDGDVQDQRLVATSGNNALDTAAMSAIQLSLPLGSFPADFNGEPLRLRFAFLYNLTPDS